LIFWAKQKTSLSVTEIWVRPALKSSRSTMPIPSPFYERMAPLSKSHQWKEWAGFLAPSSFEVNHIYEYTAFRQSAGLLDVTPLFKYEIRGPDAATFLSRVTVRNIAKLKPGRVTYCCWCDEHGKLVDDGTVACLEENVYRLSAAEPTYYWLERLARGYQVEVKDTTRDTACLALQGPTSRAILSACSDANMDHLKFFGLTSATLDGAKVQISRTGYTGDLGFEIWMENKDALPVWDALIDAGRPYDILPVGLEALDMARIEAGFILLGVDYFSAPHCILESRKSTPYEMGLDWTIQLDRSKFIGQAALANEKKEGSIWQLVGVEFDWVQIEALYDSYGLPPDIPPHACRSALPIYCEGEQVGQITSNTWSPILKKYIGLGSVRTPFSKIGQVLDVEHTVEYERRTVEATVVPRPFYDPKRKRSTPGAAPAAKG
jgi:aminomethyltransferase